VFEHGGE
jgi:anti-anti-sigma factor